MTILFEMLCHLGFITFEAVYYTYSMKSNLDLNLGRHERSSTYPTRKFKFPKSHTHFFFTAFNREYFLFLAETSAFIVSEQAGKLQLLKTIQIPALEVVDIVSTGNGDLSILHKEGVYRQLVDQLVKNIPFKSLVFEEEIKPKRLILAQNNLSIVVCEDKTLVFLKNDKIFKKFEFPSIMLIENLIMDHSKKRSNEPRLIIPNMKLNYPFVFSVQELQKWENDDYLQNVCRGCQNYYEEDEKLLIPYNGMCFSGDFYIIYVCFKNELCVLEIKRASGSEGIDYLLQTRMKVQTKWQELPLFTSVSWKSGSVVIIEKERFYETDPSKYENAKWKVKQKYSDKQKTIVAGYKLQSGLFTFLMNDQEVTRLGIMEPLR